MIWDTRHHDEDEKINLVKVSLGPGRGTTNGRYGMQQEQCTLDIRAGTSRHEARPHGGWARLASIQPWDWRKSCAHGRTHTVRGKVGVSVPHSQY